MKFLHLADLHIGKRVREYSMLKDQEEILRQILSYVDERETDGVIVAGDVYDKSVPSAEAVLLFDGFLTALAEKRQEVFIIAGNHDSAERLSFASSLIGKSGVHISRCYAGETHPVVMEKRGERINVFLLPFIRPANVRAYYPDEAISSYSEAVACAVKHMRIKKEEFNLLVTHQFVTGAVESGSEEMTVGGINNVDMGVFDDFDYVALGHIHRRQSMRQGRIHYPGAPLKYSLSEAKEERSVTLLEVKGKTSLTTEFLPLTPLFDLREEKGSFSELMKGASDDYVYLALTDEEEIPDAARELRKKYPNLMQVRYDNKRSAAAERSLPAADGERDSPLSLFRKLYYRQNNADITEEQKEYLEKVIAQIWEEDS